MFPIYYLTLAVVVAGAMLTHARILPGQLWFLVYLHNLDNNLAIYSVGNKLNVGHLWSMAVEEQFYLVWPVVVWAVRERAPLLRICYGVTAASCILCLLWPVMHLDPRFGYLNTFTRCGGLMLGSALALHERGDHFNVEQLARPAQWLTLGGIALFFAKVFITGNGSPFNDAGIAFLVPLINFIALGIVILCIVPGQLVHRICVVPWVCALGSLSYALYLFHYLFSPYVINQLSPRCCARFGNIAGHGIMLVSVWTGTYVAARLAYRFVEKPAFSFKDRIAYRDTLGSRRRPRRLSCPRRALRNLLAVEPLHF